MFRAIILAFLVTFSLPVVGHANTMTIDRSQISAADAQKIEEILNQSKGNGAVNFTDPAKLGAWVDLGKNLGQALASAAKELGTGATEFVQTPMGTLVMFSILWKLFINDIVLIALSIIMLIGGNLTMLHIYRAKTFQYKRTGPWFWPTSVERSAYQDSQWNFEGVEFLAFLIALVIINLAGFVAISHVG
jgi:hypothetical protein